MGKMPTREEREAVAADVSIPAGFVEFTIDIRCHGCDNMLEIMGLGAQNTLKLHGSVAACRHCTETAFLQGRERGLATR